MESCDQEEGEQRVIGARRCAACSGSRLKGREKTIGEDYTGSPELRLGLGGEGCPWTRRKSEEVHCRW